MADECQFVYVDGGCSGNQQTDLSKREMVSVVAYPSGAVISERREHGGSNNIAELIAVRDALAWAKECGHVYLRIFTDSENNRSWVYGKKVGKKLNDRARVIALREEIAALRKSVTIDLLWVPRAENVAGHYIEKKHGL